MRTYVREIMMFIIFKHTSHLCAYVQFCFADVADVQADTSATVEDAKDAETPAKLIPVTRKFNAIQAIVHRITSESNAFFKIIFNSLTTMFFFSMTLCCFNK